LFNELTKFLNGKNERRHSPRKRTRMNLMWVRGPADFVPGIVTEISASGLLFVIKTPPAEKAFDCVVDIGTRKIRLRLTTVRKGIAHRDGENWTFLGCSYAGIAADDYDAISRVFNDMTEPTDPDTGSVKIES
jgi:hypothetical protein